MYNFNYHQPTSLEEAVRLLQEAGDDGKLLAGGMTLLPTMKQRLAAPSDLIDLAGVETLRGIRLEGDVVVIAAMTTHAEVASDATVRAKIPALATLAAGIGDEQVRHRGTIGGSIVNNDPAADYPAGLLGLGATVHSNQGSYTADAFFTGMFETILAEDEVVTAVSIPVPDKAGYAKFPNPASRYAVVGVMVSNSPKGVRVAVTGAGPSVFRIEAMEQALSADFSPESLEGLSTPKDGLNADIHASADYRAHLIGVMAKRAVKAAG